ncbi:class F sortase [Asanoa sp. WMMD1127]|uniref:class F sortase n=1 Tax=Asanoa sp. WMMD1127 TaxID=3016107 RepID=UPI0024172655|nr:class F sortase [Asanoa sp. WMMD1127]MDG4820302.1 class F sortase [Asanoa sp. WMMD1127]
MSDSAADPLGPDRPDEERIPIIRDLLRLPGATAPPPPARSAPPASPASPARVPTAAGRPAAGKPALGTGRSYAESDGNGPFLTPRRRRVLGVPGVVTLVLLGVFLTGLGLGQASGGFALPDWFGPADKPPPREFPVLEASRPTRITIAAIGVDAPIHDVGLAKDGTIEVPPVDEPNETGWYDEGPTPGEFGPAVVVGHVDTKTGPAVFAKLSTLDPGDTVEVRRRDGSVAVFEVNSVERFDKSAVPADRLHGDFSRPGLRLITCGGRWVGGATGYADNVVVFASLVSAHDL